MEDATHRLETEQYRFLRENEHLGSRILLLTVAGSIAYGTDVSGSDLDLRGVAVESKRDIMGFSSFEQFEDDATDTVMYGLKKCLSLCLECNPNMMELLGTRQEHCLILTEEGRLLRENASLFLSKRAVKSFGSYASAQLRRLQNALARDEATGEAEVDRHVLNRVSNQLEHLKRTFSELAGGTLNVYLDESQKPGRSQELYMDIELKHFPLRDFQTIYASLGAVAREYSDLNHRNRKRDIPHLYKHAMHLLRLLVTGADILEGKGIVTYREKERDLLLSIRNGELGFDDVFRYVDEFESRFTCAAEQTTLPDEPDFTAVEKLMMAIYDNRL